MTAVPQTKMISIDEQLDAEPEVLTEIARRAFASAKRKAIAENERLGITSYGAIDGEIVARKAKTPRL